MPMVTVKSKFQVTIPAKLRKRMNLHEGDLMEATAVDDGILLRPRAVVDRKAIAKKVRNLLSKMGPPPELAGKSEDELMEEAIKLVDEIRQENRASKA